LRRVTRARFSLSFGVKPSLLVPRIARGHGDL
jgi:hypothetical protein